MTDSCPSCGPCGACGPTEPGQCDPTNTSYGLKACRSRELRGGVMYTSCECIKRNGLQDKCQRTLCQGQTACVCFPMPTCCPSKNPIRYSLMTMGVKKNAPTSDSNGNGTNGNGNGNGTNGCALMNQTINASCGNGGSPGALALAMSGSDCPSDEPEFPNPRIWNCCSAPPLAKKHIPCNK